MQEVVNLLIGKISGLLKHRRVMIVNDYDIDSCASASILWRVLKKNNVEVEHITLSKGCEGIVSEKIKKRNPEQIVIVDYVPGKILAKELDGMNVMILDHHKRDVWLDEQHEFDYFTVEDYGVKYAALAYWLYLAARDFEIGGIDWLAKLGCFWDKCMENTGFNEEDVYAKIMPQMLPFNLFVSYSQIRGAQKMVELFNESSSFEEIFQKVTESHDYKKAREEFDAELNNINFSKHAYPEIKLNVYWVNTKFKHMRVFVDYITYQNTGTHFFVLDEKTQFKFSLRTSLEINLVELIKKTKEKIPDFGGGGHMKACGAMLHSENVEELLSVLIEEYKKALEKIL